MPNESESERLITEETEEYDERDDLSGNRHTRQAPSGSRVT